MGLSFVVGVMLVGAAWGEEISLLEPLGVGFIDNALMDTELVQVFTIFRHGDRTPDEEELALYPSGQQLSDKIYFPFGKKALTNKGKQRSFFVGNYLRDLYDGFISRLYLPDEIAVRTTDYDRTKMTALTAMAAMFPPPLAQKWNLLLNWQPIPYDTEPADEDDLLYWYNCPQYRMMRNQIYEKPEVKKLLEPYQSLFKLISDKSGKNTTTPEDVFFLDNLFQTLENVGVDPPIWAIEVMPKIKAVTKIEFAVEFYNSELIKLATGVLMDFILNTTNAAIQNASKPIEPKIHIISAHENNVAALMAAARVFEAHQPNYGATFSLELRKNLSTGEHLITAVYSPVAGGPGEILTINGCANKLFCNYDEFVSLVKEVAWSKEEMSEECKKVP